MAVTSMYVIALLTSSLFLPSLTSESPDRNVCCMAQMYQIEVLTHQARVHMHCEDKQLALVDWSAPNIDVILYAKGTEICVTEKDGDSNANNGLSKTASRSTWTDPENLSASVIWLDLSRNSMKTFPELSQAKFGELQLLNLSRNRLQDLRLQHHSPLTSFKSLTTLDVSYNDMTSIPQELKQVNRDSSLTFLDVSHNSIAVIPQHAFRGVTQLVTLNVSHNQIAELTSESLAEMTSLEILDLSFNQLESLPPGLLGDVKVLKTLDLSHNCFATLPPSVFRSLKDLQELSLHHNHLADLPADLLSSATSVKMLDLSHNQLNNLPEGLFERMSSLEHLDLSNNNLKAVSVSTFKGLEKLNHLDLSYNALKTLRKASFTPLKSLWWLSLKGNLLSRLHEHVFAGLRFLNFLDLSDNDLRLDLQSLPEDLFSPLTNLHHLRLHGNDPRREGSYPEATFTSLTDLRHLTLDTFAERTFGEEFGRLRHLRTLELPGCKMERLRKTTFQGFEARMSTSALSSTLMSLRMEGCPLKEIEECALCGLTSLEELVLNNRTATDDAAEALQAQPTEASSTSSAKTPLLNCSSFLGPSNAALRKLDLSGMGLGSKVVQSLSDDALMRLDRLEVVDLSSNGLRELNLSLPSVRYLVLSENALTSIPVDVETLNKLVFLDVSNNNISALTSQEMTSLDRLAVKHDVTVKLTGNNFTCFASDCQHAEFFDWLCLETSPVHFADSSSCDSPCMLDTERWVRVRDAQLSCKNWSFVWGMLSILLVTVATLLCVCLKRKESKMVPQEFPSFEKPSFENNIDSSKWDKDHSRDDDEDDVRFDSSESRLIESLNPLNVSSETSDDLNEMNVCHRSGGDSTDASFADGLDGNDRPSLPWSARLSSRLSTFMQSVPVFGMLSFHQRKHQTDVKEPLPRSDDSDSSSDDDFELSQKSSKATHKKTSERQLGRLRRGNLVDDRFHAGTQNGESSRQLSLRRHYINTNAWDRNATHSEDEGVQKSLPLSPETSGVDNQASPRMSRVPTTWPPRNARMNQPGSLFHSFRGTPPPAYSEVMREDQAQTNQAS